ncbi:MAG: MotA/TolQ/ExbB proton channel family protein [Alphaproteobacteria bacterium]
MIGAPAPERESVMSFNWSEIWQHMGVPAMTIAALLLVMGLASLTVFIERMIALRRSQAASREFAAAVGAKIGTGDIDGAIDEAGQYERSHLAKVTRAALSSWQEGRGAREAGGLPPVEKARRHVERVLEETGEEMRSGMSVLATVGSVAPFVGLLGTVVGIISAFQGIAATGSGGLSSVSAGISEALIETALGLAVAIPAVLAFNYLSTAMDADESKLSRAAGQLLDDIENWDRVETSGARRGRVA